MKDKIFDFLNNIEPISTAHGTGNKQVFLSNKETANKLTQFAYGILKPGEKCKEHIHPTMEEYFYFIKGSGIYYIEKEKYNLNNGTFLRIASGKKHKLVCKTSSKENLEFAYFGIAE